MFIDAVVIKGQTRPFTCSIQTTEYIQNTDKSNPTNGGYVWNPADLSNCSIRLRIMGSPTADAAVLVEHIITQETDEFTEGQITYPEGGQFTFVITAEDTDIIGLGNHPIMLELVQPNTLETIYTLTEGGRKGEYSRVQVVQV